jgi:hypothetical protein
MNRPPLWMNVRVRDEQNDTRFFIPLPLFLLLPLVLAFLIILSPFILIAAIVLGCMGWGFWVFRALGSAFGVVCAMRGLEVNVRSPQQIVKVSVI